MARPRGNYAVTAERRAAILQSAFEVFARSGYRGGSLKDIAEIVGISEAGILHHFKTKSNLLIAVLTYRDDRSGEYLDTNAGSGAEFIDGWLKLIKYNSSIPGVVELFTILSAEATAVDHPAHDYFQQRYAFVVEVTTKFFRLLREEGRLRPDIEPEGASRALIALSDGLQVQWLLNRDWDMLEEHRGFFRGVLTEQAGRALVPVNGAPLMAAGK